MQKRITTIPFFIATAFSLFAPNVGYIVIEAENRTKKKKII